MATKPHNMSTLKVVTEMRYIHFNNVSIRNKLLLVYFVSVFIPIVVTNIIFYYVTTENVKTQKTHDLSLTVKQMSNEFQKGIDDAMGISYILYTDNKLYDFLEVQYETPADFVKAYNADFRDIKKYVSVYAPMNAINVYTDNQTVVQAGGIYPINEQVEASDWYKKTDPLRQLYPILTRIKRDSDGLYTLTIIRELNYYGQNNFQKILKIELDSSFINHMFNNITFPGDVYLVNDDGVIGYTTDKDIQWTEKDYQFDSISIPSDKVVLEEQLEHLDQWSVIGIVSENTLVDEVRDSGRFILYLAVANFVLPSILIIYLTSSLHNRLSRIVQHLRKVEVHNFDLIEGDNYLDEIGELTDAFNRMFKRIKKLINDVYVVGIQKKDEELQRKQAQLNALQTQINPHFLFNVLETIRMRSVLKKEHETADIIHNMSKFLRTSFTWGKDWVTVKEEAQLIHSFLEIQQYRYGHKLQYDIDVDSSVYEYVIPNMLLIPFVENATIHGVEPLKRNGRVEIKVKSDSSHLVCIIKDNGIGMDKEKLTQLCHSLEKGEIGGEHIGIKNVYHRLKLHYGDQCDFQIESSQGYGTLIKIKVPLQT